MDLFPLRLHLLQQEADDIWISQAHHWKARSYPWKATLDSVKHTKELGSLNGGATILNPDAFIDVKAPCHYGKGRWKIVFTKDADELN